MDSAASIPIGTEQARTLPSGANLMTLSGWGRYPACKAEVYRPEKVAELSDLVHRGGSMIARGAGRAYGDAALNEHGRVINLERLNRMLAFDEATGIIRCEAGVTLDEIIRVFIRRGWFPPVVPGTRFVTLGGSVAADIHGKGHHRDSSLGAHVSSLDLMLASGEIRRCSREENTDLFMATLGGMGLTGVILSVEMRLRRIESAWIAGETIVARDIDQAIAAFEDIGQRYGNSLAWIDCGGRSRDGLGRSVIIAGNFASPGDLDQRRGQAPFDVPPKIRAGLPFDLPSIALNSLTVRAFNAAYYRFHSARSGASIRDYQGFFFPLDAIGGWNRMYGLRGFVQYQCVWPLAHSREGLIEVLEAIGRSRRGSFLTVLKKFGAQDGILSFPMPGYTLALDFAVDDGLFAFLDSLDRRVLARGGRVYLAKDARMRPEIFREMYLNFARWREIKGAADPNNMFSSSLSRRLRIDAN
jgi:decaprenylphospho-beta-D-ribofuranose 2-oxidase